MFSVPPSFSRAFGSPVMSQKSKIESDWETAESERSELSTTFSRVKDENSLLVSRDLRRKNDKEERFRNNYRLAEKQQKMRTGKCEGYSFFSIKAGLRKQDFRDTINLSPTNVSKGGARHVSDVVKAVLQNAATGSSEPSTTPGNGTVVSENEIDDNKSIEYQQSSLENENEHEKPDGFMNEEDWQLARSKKLKPLRSRGSNRISAQMNLDSFIDSALSEQLKENDKMEAPVDMSLTDLQSPKLIESRFGWKKVRRAVTIVRTVSSLSEKRISAPAAAVVQSLTTESSNSTLIDIDGSIKNSDKLSSLPSSPKHAKANKDSIEQTDTTTAIVSNQTTSQRSPLPRPSTANNTRSNGSNRLAFTVPESATFIRPHSAIVRPTKPSVLSVMSPLDEFIDIVRQETGRSKAGSLISNTSQLPPHQQQQQLGDSTILERPKTATLRIAPPPAIITTNTTNNTLINEENNDYLTLHNEIADDDTLRRQERLVYRNYSGLIYHDPSKTRTWEGVSEMLSPPPLLSATGDINDPFQLHRFVRSDTRWAGKTLNSYRPWSPERRTVQYSHLHSPLQSPSHIQTGEFPLMTILDTSTVQQEEVGEEEESPEQQTSGRKPSARLSARLSARKQQQQSSQQQPHPLLNTSSAALTTTTSSSLPELKSHRSGYSHSGTTTPTKPHHAPYLQHVQKDAVFTSTSSLGMNSARNTPKNARPASAQGVFRPHSQSQTSPSSHFKPTVVSAETSNVRPFSARAPSSTHICETRQLQRPATAAPSSPSSLHEEFNRSSSHNNTSIEQGGHSYSHSHSAPALSRNSLHRDIHNNFMQLASNSGISTAKAHLSGTRSTVSKRTPLLINIITRNPSSTTDIATTTATTTAADQKRMTIKKKQR